MRILYFVHSVPKYEQSGTPIAAWSVAKKIKEKYQWDIGFVIPTSQSIGKFNELKREIVEDIVVYHTHKIEFLDNFFHSFYKDFELQRKYIIRILKDFKPDLICIYNFIFNTYQILKDIKFYDPNIKVVRVFTHTEDVCWSVDPLIINNGKVLKCSGPYPLSKCIKHYRLSIGEIDPLWMLYLLIGHFHYVEYIHNKYTDKIIFTSEKLRDYITSYIDLNPNKIEIIPHGVPIPSEGIDRTNNLELYKNKNNNILVTFVGGTHPRKGLDIFLKAIDSDLIISENLKFVIIGRNVDMTLYNRLKTLISRYNEKIIYLGEVDEGTKIELFKQSDLIVTTSYFECYGLVVREALLCGTPVISTRFMGSEIIEHGKDGFLIDNHLELREILIKISKNPEILENMKSYILENSIRKIPSIDDEVEMYKRIFESLTYENKRFSKRSKKL